MKLEIERKFLLKAMPDIKPTEIIKIDQYYFKNAAGTWERARSWNSNINGKSYIHTVKKSVSKGVNLEDEKFLTEKEFQQFKSHCLLSTTEARFITKERWIYPDGNLKWEVDLFKDNYHLIIAEIEIPSEDYNLVLPEFISKKSLLEVTGMKQFSNRSLSIKLK